jgi:UDP-N-acetylmuramate dehydrogenase
MSLDLQENVSLADYCTMQLGGPARYLCTVESKESLAEAVDWANAQGLKTLMLGGGSNVVFDEQGFNGLVIIDQIMGIEIIEDNYESTVLRIGAGESWDALVKKTVDMNLSGIEALSLIPGSVGGTPVQNVGAYGQEVGTSLVEIEVYDALEKSFTTRSRDDLDLAYRSSNLKVPVEQRRYFINSVTLKLSKTMTLVRPFYDALEKYFVKNNVQEVTPQSVRDAVIAIRSSKLPDPATTPNSGSFFANPIVDAEVYEAIKSTYPEVRAYPYQGQYKLAAGWLIEAAGLKDYAAYGLKTYEKQALVIVNESAEHAADLMKFRDEIIAKVKEKFNVTLEQEPELID